MRRILKSLANISSSRICGESIAGASSGSRTLFLWVSVFISMTAGPPGASSVERKAEGSEEKPWLNAEEPLPRPWSGNLYKQGVRDPGEKDRKKGWGRDRERPWERKIGLWESKGKPSGCQRVLKAAWPLSPLVCQQSVSQQWGKFWHSSDTLNCWEKKQQELSSSFLSLKRGYHTFPHLKTDIK